MLVLSELGQELKTAREQKGLSFDDLQKITKIQKRYLEAIEKGDYSQLPGEFYTRAFIKSYAESVGLDFKSLAEQYPGDMPKVERQHIETRVTPPDGSENEQAPKKLRRSAVRVNNWSSLINKAIIVVFVLIGVMIIYILVTQFAGHQSTSPSDQNNTNSVQYKADSTSQSSSKSHTSDSSSTESSDTSSEQTLKKDKQEGNITTYTLSGTEKFDVVVTAATANQAWFQAKDNQTGQTIAEGTASKTGQESYHFDASKVQSLSLKFGNAPGTELKINGKKVAIPSQSTVQTMIINFSK
ncbi:helix-turn-helix domain-containing protein [Sporolactobacillus terrae]|uniref:helix-turn-helix domain-containing protein n=1 Tax=Sporolactobacillus terrae TaxID=269673 RepID=UPI001E3BE169|nr:RodZ domain-containing protein [Sporolactobacillus terrae]